MYTFHILGWEITYTPPFADPAPQEVENAKPKDILLNLTWRRGCYNLSNPERAKAAQDYVTQYTFKESLKYLFVVDPRFGEAPAGRATLTAYLCNDSLTKDALSCYKVDSVFRNKVHNLGKQVVPQTEFNHLYQEYKLSRVSDQTGTATARHSCYDRQSPK
jgi:hypothetical protein